MSGSDGLAWVFVTNAIMTSQGPGPSPKLLPAAEAGAVIARKMGIYGSQPPAGYAWSPGRAASN